MSNAPDTELIIFINCLLILKSDKSLVKTRLLIFNRLKEFLVYKSFHFSDCHQNNNEMTF